MEFRNVILNSSSIAPNCLKTFPQPSAAGVVESRMSQNLLENIVANLRPAPIIRSVNWNWKWSRALALAALLALGAGCGGIHASRSVSPLDFFFPAHGLLKVGAPAPRDSNPASPPGELLAQN